MKIAFVSHNRCGLNMGGLQRQIVMSKEALQQLGHNVILWNPWEGIAAGAYDVAHFFTADHTLLPVHAAFTEQGIPTVLSPVLGAGNLSRRRQQVRRELALSPLPIYQDLSRVIALVRQAGKIVALHEKEQMLCEFYGRTGGIVRIPNGVDDIFTRGRSDRGHSLAGSENYFMHVGQFWPNKGQLWLIENWDHIEADLVLVGDAPTGQSDYHAACRRAAGGRDVHFLGGFSPDSQELADLYAGARGLLLNSQSEVAPIVMNEAFAAGTPVAMPAHLVSDKERLPDSTFTLGDVRSFRKALTSLQGPRVSRPGATWNDVSQELVKVYEAMVQ